MGELNAAAAASDDPDVVRVHEYPRCTLLGGSFAVIVQVGLGVAAISVLIYKRHAERPKRPWMVWFFDTTKQCFAGGLQHFVNLAFGMMFAVSGGASECSWYLINFAITVGCGVFLLWGAMKLYTRIVDRYQLTLLRSGEYGNPPNWKPWLAQLLIWGFLASFEKVITAALVILPLHSQLDRFASWLEGPLLPYPTAELLLVMVLAPVLLNIMFFWVMDNLIMRKRPKVGPSEAEYEEVATDVEARTVPAADDEGPARARPRATPSARRASSDVQQSKKADWDLKTPKVSRFVPP